MSHSFDDADLELEKHARSPSAHKHTYSDVTLPSLYLQPPQPRRGLAPAPLPAFPRELVRAAQHARDSSETSSHTFVDARAQWREKEGTAGWKGRFRESFSTFAPP
jgi:hypothetical protein